MTADSGAKPQVTRLAAYGLVINDGQILLCRISELLNADKGKWVLPGGGIDFGEEPRDAAVREVFEETGLHVRIAGLVEVNSRLIHFDDRVMHAVRIIYRVDVLGGELTNEVDGSTDLCAWFTRDEALQLPILDLTRRGIELAFGTDAINTST